MLQLLTGCFRPPQGSDGQAASQLSLDSPPEVLLATTPASSLVPLLVPAVPATQAPEQQHDHAQRRHVPDHNAVLAATATQEHAEASVLLLLDATGQQVLWSNCPPSALEELRAVGAGGIHILQQLLGFEEDFVEAVACACETGLWQNVISSDLAGYLLDLHVQQQAVQTECAHADGGPISIPAEVLLQPACSLLEQQVNKHSKAADPLVPATVSLHGDSGASPHVIAASLDAGHTCARIGPTTLWQSSRSPSSHSPALPSSRVPSGSTPAMSPVDTSAVQVQHITQATEWPACTSRLTSENGAQHQDGTPGHNTQGRVLVQDMPIAAWRYSSDNCQRSSRQVAAAQQNSSGEAQHAMTMLQRACASHSGAAAPGRQAGALHQAISCRQASIEPISGAPSHGVLTQHSVPMHPGCSAVPEDMSSRQTSVHDSHTADFLLSRECSKTGHTVRLDDSSSRELSPGSVLQPTNSILQSASSTLQLANSGRRRLTTPSMPLTGRPADYLTRQDSQDVSSPYLLARKEDMSSPMAASQASTSSGRRKPATAHGNTVGAQMRPKKSALMNSMGFDQLPGQASSGIASSGMGNSNSEHIWPRGASQSGLLAQSADGTALQRLLFGSHSQAGHMKTHSGIQPVATPSSAKQLSSTRALDWEEELANKDGLRVNSAEDMIQSLLGDNGATRHESAPRVPSASRMLVKHSSNSTMNSASSAHSANAAAMAAASSCASMYASAEHRNSPLQKSAGPSPALNQQSCKSRPCRAPSTPMILSSRTCTPAAATAAGQDCASVFYRRSQSMGGWNMSATGSDEQAPDCLEAPARQVLVGSPPCNVPTPTPLQAQLMQPLLQQPTAAQGQDVDSTEHGSGSMSGAHTVQEQGGEGDGRGEGEGEGEGNEQQERQWWRWLRTAEVCIRPVKQCNLPPGSPPLLLVSCVDVTLREYKANMWAQVEDRILHLVSQMFPMHVMHYLSLKQQQQNGFVARKHDDITILFMDVVGFTSMSKEVEPLQVISYLNKLFSVLDELVTIYGLHKVETAGDCYIVCSGVLSLREDGFLHEVQEHDKYNSACLIMECAKEMLAEASQVLMPHNQQPTQVRIGIHTGNAMSGLVGSKLPKWSIYGDSINTASRMESTSQPGRIQVSAVTRELLPHETWQETGGVEVKGKGVMETFLWVPSSQPQTPAVQLRALQEGGNSILVSSSNQQACADSSLMNLRNRNALAPIQELEPGMSQLDASTCYASATVSDMPSVAGVSSQESSAFADLHPCQTLDITASELFATHPSSAALHAATSLRRRLSRSSSSHAQHPPYDRQSTVASGASAHSGPLPRIQIMLDSQVNVERDPVAMFIGTGHETQRSAQQDVAAIWQGISAAASRRTSMDNSRPYVRTSCDRQGFMRTRLSFEKSVSPAAGRSSTSDDPACGSAGNSNVALQRLSHAAGNAQSSEQRRSLEIPAVLLNSLLASHTSMSSMHARSSQSSQDAHGRASRGSHTSTHTIESRTLSSQQQGHDLPASRVTGTSHVRHGKSLQPCTSNGSGSSLNQRARCLLRSKSSRQLFPPHFAAAAVAAGAGISPGATPTAHTSPSGTFIPVLGVSGGRARRGSTTDILMGQGQPPRGDDSGMLVHAVLESLPRLGMPGASPAASRPRPARQLRWGAVEHKAADGSATDSLVSAALRERNRSEALTLQAQHMFLRKDSTGDEARSGGSGLLASGPSWRTSQADLFDSDPDGNNIAQLLLTQGNTAGRTSAVTSHRAVRTLMDQHGSSQALAIGSGNAAHARPAASHLSSSPRPGGGSNFSLTALMHAVALTSCAPGPSGIGTTADDAAAARAAVNPAQVDLPYGTAARRRQSMVQLPRKHEPSG